MKATGTKRSVTIGLLGLSLVLAGSFAMSAPALAQFTDLLAIPKTLIDRAIEARSASDIGRDNEIVLKVNAVMADVGTVKASSEIYEQRLLITGIFDDKAVYDRFQTKIRGIRGVKKLYWHAIYLAPDDPKRASLLDWSDALIMDTKAEARLVGNMDVADVNYRVATDSQGVVYVLGRARSNDERKTALARAKDGDGVKKVVDYIEVRP